MPRSGINSNHAHYDCAVAIKDCHISQGMGNFVSPSCSKVLPQVDGNCVLGPWARLHDTLPRLLSQLKPTHKKCLNKDAAVWVISAAWARLLLSVVLVLNLYACSVHQQQRVNGALWGRKVNNFSNWRKQANKKTPYSTIQLFFLNSHLDLV